MNKLSIFTLKAIRKLYTKCFGSYQLPPLQREEDPDKVSEMIYNLLVDDKPCMIARFGGFELTTIINFLGVKSEKKNITKYIKGDVLEWWWNDRLITQMNTNAGFFPPTPEKLEQFCQLMIESTKEVDILASWQPNEFYMQPYLKATQYISFEPLNPYFTESPWTRALEGKKVLVIHPFSQLIEEQYNNNRIRLFQNPSVLPDFELQTIKSVQSLGGESQGFTDWFEALQWMESEIDKHDFDIALIGCGAYGFPLAAYIKKQGKKAIHIGGSLQLLFGIRGRRWEDPNYNTKYNYLSLMNRYWIRPNNSDKTENFKTVENGCYW